MKYPPTGTKNWSQMTRACVAEALGTFFLVFLGTGSVASAVSHNALLGLWQIASTWGFGVSLAIFSTAGVSGAHLNPAVSLALALTRPNDFPMRKLLPYIISQLFGSLAAGALVLLCYGSSIRAFEKEHAIVRDSSNGTLSAKAFGEYPSVEVGAAGACAVEGLGTGILIFMIFALTDERNPARPPPGMAPFFIGFTVAVLIAVLAPLTQGGFNPARQ